MKEKNIIVKVLSIVAIVVVTVFVGVIIFLNTHFWLTTQVNGIDCSFLTVEQAGERINKQIASKPIILKFANEKEYQISGKDIKLCFKNEKELEEIFNKKESKSFNTKKDYKLSNSFSFNIETLRKYLETVPELNEKSVVPQNAYLNWDEENHKIGIVPEVIGNIDNVEDALKLAKEALENGETDIDLTVTPKILSTSNELIETKENVNNILNTSINYELEDGSTVTLNWDTWAKKNDNGTWNIEVDGNLTEFVELLDKKIKEINKYCEFPSTDKGNVRLTLKESLRKKLNKDFEIKRIKEFLETGRTYNVEPTYTKSTFETALSNYLEIDLSRQSVWFYKDGKCIVSGRCVSGDIRGGHCTPAGMFYLDGKTTSTYLKGLNNDGSRYNSYVNYWMPFNGGIGLHDATWRSNFGGNIYRYNGSHGCINLPYSVARNIYQNIDYNTLIVVYWS